MAYARVIGTVLRLLVDSPRFYIVNDMVFKVLPFDITPQVNRILEDILYLEEHIFLGHYGGQDNLILLIRDQTLEEEKRETPKQDFNRTLLWKHLETIGGITTFGFGDFVNSKKLLKEITDSLLRRQSLMGKHAGEKISVGILKVQQDGKTKLRHFSAHPKSLDEDYKKLETFLRSGYTAIKLLDIEPLKELLNKIEFDKKEPHHIQGRKEIEALSQAEKEKTVGNIERLICMDGEGDFTIGKHKDRIPFKSKKAGYYKVFVAIYKITGGTGGIASYKKISEHIRLHFRSKEEFSMKDIQNHINNSIKRRYLPKETPDGKEIISSDSEGKAVIFYNPVIG